MNDTAQIVRAAEDAKVKRTFWFKAKLWIESRSATEIFVVIGMFAVLCGLTWWEQSNAATGWQMLATGYAPAWIAGLFGFCLPVGVFIFHRRMAEFHRDGKSSKAAQAGVVMIALAGLTLFGVFSNIASKSEVQQNAAMENNAARGVLLAEVQALEMEVTDERYLRLVGTKQVTESQIKSREAEAKGWGFDPVEIPETKPVQYTYATIEQCAADLRARERQICNDLNGNGDEPGLRGRLLLVETDFAIYESNKALLEEKKAELKERPRIEGDGHWSAMQRISGGGMDADGWRIWGTLFVSAFVLIALAFGWDLFLEAREEETEDALKEAV
jgi:hypothetical protein